MLKFTIIGLLGFAGVAHADPFTVGDITVTDAFARESAKRAQAGAGYFDITNTGDAKDALLGVESNYPRAMMHQTVMDGDVAKMERLMRVPLAPGETVSFAPGGNHVMFMGLGDHPFVAGDEIPATLVFENAGRIDIVFVVKSFDKDESESADH